MIYIIGAGLFGGVARDLLRREGFDCKTIDDNRPLSGSYPAGCLIKPGWLTKLGKAREPALELLDEMYGLRTMNLRGMPGTIQHCPPSRILRAPDICDRVGHIDPEAGLAQLCGGGNVEGTLLVAAGVWTQELCDVPVTGIQGCSMRYAGGFEEAAINVWAPYKQTVAFEIEPGITWCGDGTGIKPDNWKPFHEERALGHAADMGLTDLQETRVGIRPYVKGRTGYFERVGKRCWVSTGGAKNGVALAAVQAKQFLESIT